MGVTFIEKLIRLFVVIKTQGWESLKQVNLLTIVQSVANKNNVLLKDRSIEHAQIAMIIIVVGRCYIMENNTFQTIEKTAE